MQNKDNNTSSMPNKLFKIQATTDLFQSLSFAERLKATRKKAGLTGKEISEITKIALSTYMSYENETRKKRVMPSAENLIKISDALGVSTDYLLKGRKNIYHGEHVHVIKIPKNLTVNDIAPFIEQVKNMLLIDNEVSYSGQKLDSKTRGQLYRDLGYVEIHAMLKTGGEEYVKDLIEMARYVHNHPSYKKPTEEERDNIEKFQRLAKLIDVLLEEQEHVQDSTTSKKQGTGNESEPIDSDNDAPPDSDKD